MAERSAKSERSAPATLNLEGKIDYAAGQTAKEMLLKMLSAANQ